MSISRVGNTDFYIYQNVVERNNRGKGGTLFNRSGMSAASNLRDASGENGRFSINDAYNSMMAKGRFRSEIGERYLQNVSDRNINLLAQSKGEIQKVDNERYVINISDEIAGCWCIYDKDSDHSFTFDPLSTSIQTDAGTGRDYIVSCAPNGQLMNVKYVDSALIEGIKTFLHTDQLAKSALNDKYSIEVHGYTGIEVLRERGKEGKGAWLMMNGDQRQLDKLQELADLYKEKYPNLVKSDDLAKGLALEEVAGLTVRTANGFITVACNGIQYMDNNDQSKGWGFMFSENDTDIYDQIMQAITEGGIKGGIESASGWEEWFQEKGRLYERIYSDGDLALVANGKEMKII